MVEGAAAWPGLPHRPQARAQGDAHAGLQRRGLLLQQGQLLQRQVDHSGRNFDSVNWGFKRTFAKFESVTFIK